MLASRLRCWTWKGLGEVSKVPMRSRRDNPWRSAILAGELVFAYKRPTRQVSWVPWLKTTLNACHQQQDVGPCIASPTSHRPAVATLSSAVRR